MTSGPVGSQDGRVDRVCVIGNSGAGKTTFARALSERAGLLHIELDGIYHQADWQPLETEAFLAEVTLRCSAPRWVTDGNYSAVTGVMWPKADTILWLDYPRWRTTWRVIRRSIGRALTGAELWNGNRESWRNLCSLDKERNVVLWSITAHRGKRQRYEAAIEGGEFGTAVVHRFQRPADAANWLERQGKDGCHGT